MKHFVLEDDKNRIAVFREKLNEPGNTVTICSSVEEGKRILREDGPFDVIFLDHDLDGYIYVPSTQPNTGWQLAKWISENDIPGEVIIHSYNEFAVPRMIEVLPRAKWIPFNTGNLFGE